MTNLTFVRPTNIVVSRLTLELSITKNILFNLKFSEIFIVNEIMIGIGK